MIWYPNDVGNLHIYIHQPRLFWVVNFQTEPYAGCLWMPVECSAASWTCWTCGTRFPFCGPSVGKMSGIGPWFFDGLTTDNQIQSICSVHGLPRRVSEITRNQHCILLHGSRKKRSQLFLYDTWRPKGRTFDPKNCRRSPQRGAAGRSLRAFGHQVLSRPAHGGTSGTWGDWQTLVLRFFQSIGLASLVITKWDCPSRRFSKMEIAISCWRFARCGECLWKSFCCESMPQVRQAATRRANFTRIALEMQLGDLYAFLF